MKLFHPQVQIARQRQWNQPDEFILHAVTFCPRTHYRANGFILDKEEGLMQISLQIFKDPALPDLDYLTPVAHTIPLGSFPDGADDGIFDVTVEVEIPVLSRGGEAAETDKKPAAKTTVSSTSADEDSKPVMDL